MTKIKLSRRNRTRLNKLLHKSQEIMFICAILFGSLTYLTLLTLILAAL